MNLIPWIIDFESQLELPWYYKTRTFSSIQLDETLNSRSEVDQRQSALRTRTVMKSLSKLLSDAAFL